MAKFHPFPCSIDRAQYIVTDRWMKDEFPMNDYELILLSCHPHRPHFKVWLACSWPKSSAIDWDWSMILRFYSSISNYSFSLPGKPNVCPSSSLCRLSLPKPPLPTPIHTHSESIAGLIVGINILFLTDWSAKLIEFNRIVRIHCIYHSTAGSIVRPDLTLNWPQKRKWLSSITMNPASGWQWVAFYIL